MKTLRHLPTALRAFLVPFLASICLSATAHAQTTFAQFTQDNNSEPFTFSNLDQTFNGTTTGNFTFLADGAPVGPQSATITLSSSTTAPAIPTVPFGPLFQPMDGAMNTLSFTRISDNANLLTLTFTGTFFGFDGDSVAALSGNSGLGDTVVFTSDFLTFSGAAARSFSLDAFPDPDYSLGGNGFLNDFATDLDGSFAAVVVPEPSTWIVGAVVAIALAGFRFFGRAHSVIEPS